ncbi:hypothetical protein [uncultured Treponema sp.]|uniref:hypothetical protein n=1 Tax=uncultured Treponema sp. TaxID=162155 RepID=UPI0025895A58|nr:hypothetical protein [uncultured Treponema sp.]
MNIKKFSFAFLPVLILALVSCMNMNSSNGKEGAIRITVPGEERGLYTFNKSNASSYKVSIILDKEVIDSQTAELGGVITFDELEPATYTVKAEAFDSDGIRIGSGSIEVKVVAGETTEKTILMILTNGGEIYETNYLLFFYNSSTNKYYYADAGTSEITDESFTGSNSVIAGYTESNDGAAYRYFKNNDTADGGNNSTSNFASFYKKSNGDQSYFKITYQDDTPVIDPFYYDETTDALWIGHYATTNNTLKFLKIENPSTKFSSIQNYPTFATSTGFSVSGATYTAFAIQGSDIYIAYTNSGTSYLQRGTITGSNDSGFSITAKGTAQSTEQMGVAGTINDIAILYDGYVYVLISDIEKLTGHTINDGDTVKSRGAILKILGTDSGFEVEDILGWTNSARTISSKLNNDSNNLYNNIDKIYQINSIKAYIPKLSESSKKFYGAERFVAIKPKELAIADCGANIILPDYKNKKNGNMFQHDRVVTVNLYDFAITNITELNNLDFKSLSISGVISYIDTFTSSYSSDEE